MPKRLLLLLSLIPALLISLVSCWTPQWRWGVDVRDIAKRSDMLNQAPEISVEDFFIRRMRNRVRKAPVGNWMLLHEDETFVYLGYPRFSGLLNDQRDVTELFKTPLKDLESRFPGWRSLDGEEMQTVLRTQFGRIPEQWEAVLEDSYIRVTGTLSEDTPVNASPKGRTFELRLDKKTLVKLGG